MGEWQVGGLSTLFTDPNECKYNTVKESVKEIF